MVVGKHVICHCSLYERCRQRYLVYYESYRDEILHGRVRSETASSDEI